MMLFMEEVLQTLVVETAGVGCVAAIIFVYWKCMTKRDYKETLK